MTDVLGFVGLGLILTGLLTNKKARASVMGIGSYDHLYKKYAAQLGLDWKMLKAIAMIESSEGKHPSVAYGIMNPTDIEKSLSEDRKSLGLMQLRLSTAQDYDKQATGEKLNNPEYSIMIAAKHLKRLSSIFKSEEYIIKSYNQGEGRTAHEIAGTKQGLAYEYYRRYRTAKAKIPEGI